MDINYDKKRKKMNWLLFIFIIIMLYFIIFTSTDSIVSNVENIMLGNVDSTITKNSPLERYNIVGRFPNAKVEANITRLFVAHNFFDGYMWVIYSYQTVENDSDIKPATNNVISRWKIHREDGKWQVVEIQEKP